MFKDVKYVSMMTLSNMPDIKDEEPSPDVDSKNVEEKDNDNEESISPEVLWVVALVVNLFNANFEAPEIRLMMQTIRLWIWRTFLFFGCIFFVLVFGKAIFGGLFTFLGFFFSSFVETGNFILN